MTHSLTNAFLLNDKHAWVSAATRGIGQACALALAEHGAQVTVTGRDAAALQALSQRLPAPHNGQHHTVVVDHEDAKGVKTAIRNHVDELGPIHILINNSGGPPGGPITDATGEQFSAWFAQHLLCNHFQAQAVLPGMTQAGYGRIINIVSTSVKQPIKGLGVSNTIRGAVASWSKTLSGEVAPFGITVNNILPGATATDRLMHLVKTRAEASGRSEDDVSGSMQREIPMGRFAQPAEIAAAVVFLASPAASYITGVSLPVDGGRTDCL